MKFNLFKLAIKIVLEFILFSFNFYTIIVTVFCKRQQWLVLIHNLKNVKCSNSYQSLIVSNIVFWTIIIYTHWDIVDAFNDIFGWPMFVIIMYACLRILIYLDLIFSLGKSVRVEVIVDNVSIIFMFL
ncbi:hypothetical protein BDFB_013866, partial [Asbolus verrucosus]